VRHQDDAGRVPSGLRSSPTGRVPAWVLHDAAPPEPWRSWTPGPPSRPARRQRSWTGIGGAVLVVAIVAIGAVGTQVGVLPGAAALGAGPAGNGPGWPTPGFEEADEPLGTPIVAAAGGPHDFVHTQDDGVTPVAYDPCRPVHYVIRPANQPLGGDQLVHDAVARISQVTGLQFVYDGVTDEAPSDSRDAVQEDRYGDRWAPVLVSWETVAEQPDFAADVAGLGGSQAVSVGDGPDVFVTGTVELDAAGFADVLTWPGGTGIARAIVLHELGHVVGLDHVDDPRQLMYASASDVLDFADGDLAGLARLGSGACAPQL
jgi:hypothetical protein